MNRFSHSTRGIRTGPLIVVAAVAVGALAACGDDSDTAAASTMPVGEWVAEFDQLCADIASASTPEMSEAEFKEISDAGLAEMRALPEPDEHAAEADAMLDAIEATTDPAVAEADIEALDQQFLASAEVLDVSQECINGPQG
ncbi:MAG TPA: hypothetical protein VMW08_15560 [Acidimicrobiales bacterium]|nr:hypothetical protein [Acidimicrobiales bacterium]